ALLDQCLRIGEHGDALAGVALTAAVVSQALAVGRLREHARQREFADAARSSEEQGVRHAMRAQRPTESSDDARIAEEVAEAHQRPPCAANEASAGSTAARTSAAISSAGRMAFAAESKHWTVAQGARRAN